MAKLPVQPTIVIDFEGSGPRIASMRDAEGDSILGFGIVAGYMDPETGMPVIARRMSVGIVALNPWELVPSTTGEWLALWKLRSWNWTGEDSTFDFWSGRADPSDHGKLTGHLPALTNLWTQPKPGDAFYETHHVTQSYVEAANMLDEFLGAVEHVSPTGSYVWVTDNAAYDTCLAFGLLTQNGKLPMTHLRNGQYRWHGTYDEDSLLVQRPLATIDWERDVSGPRKVFHEKALAALPMPNQPHHPQVDAATILLRHLFASAPK